MKSLRNALVVGGASFLFCMGAPSTAKSGSNGINALILVTQTKAQQANEEALKAAEKQRKELKEQKGSRAQRDRLRELIKLNKKHARNYAAISKRLKAAQAKLKKANCE